MFSLSMHVLFVFFYLYHSTYSCQNKDYYYCCYISWQNGCQIWVLGNNVISEHLYPTWCQTYLFIKQCYGLMILYPGSCNASWIWGDFTVLPTSYFAPQAAALSGWCSAKFLHVNEWRGSLVHLIIISRFFSLWIWTVRKKNLTS